MNEATEVFLDDFIIKFLGLQLQKAPLNPALCGLKKFLHPN
jgi:hypothetical protein